MIQDNLEKGKTMDIIKRLEVASSYAKGRSEKRAQSSFRAVKLFCTIVHGIYMSLYIIKIHRMHHTKVTPNEDCTTPSELKCKL